jgi:ATP-binding cassette subfamily B protein
VRRASAGSRLLLTLLWRRRWTFLADALLGATFFLVGMVPGLLAKAVFDRLDGSGSSPVTVLLAVLVLVKVVHVCLGIGWMALDTALRGALLMLLRRNLFERVLARPAARALPVPVGDALSRFVEDVRQVVETLCKRSGLMNLTSSLSFAAVAVVVMLRIDAYVTVLVLLPVLGVLALSYLAGQRITRFRARSRAAAGDVSAFLNDLFAGVQLIKLTGAERNAVSRLMAMNRVRRRAAIGDSVFFTVMQSSSRLVLAMGTGLILLVASGRLRSGEFGVGDLALFTYLLEEVGIGVAVLGDFLRHWRQAEVSADRLAELTPARPLTELTRPATAPPAAAYEPLRCLEVRGLDYRHDGGGRGISGVDLTLAPGCVVVVTGRVGAGKTTLVQSLLGQLPTPAGTIRWNGTAIDPAAALRPPRCAYTPQLPAFFSTTVRENILLGVPSDGAVEAAAAYRAVFDEDVARMPDGYDTVVGPLGRRLSGGQRQRLAAARMFARPAELRIVDDISSALDEGTEDLLWERVFAEADRGTALLVVSNRRGPLLRADEIIVLAGGRVVGRGGLSDLLAGCAEFHDVCPAGLQEGATGRDATA